MNIEAQVFCQGLVAQMKSAGINVILKDEVAEHFAIMDEELLEIALR